MYLVALYPLFEAHDPRAASQDLLETLKELWPRATRIFIGEAGKIRGHAAAAAARSLIATPKLRVTADHIRSSIVSLNWRATFLIIQWCVSDSHGSCVVSQVEARALTLSAWLPEMLPAVFSENHGVFRAGTWTSDPDQDRVS